MSILSDIVDSYESFFVEASNLGRSIFTVEGCSDARGLQKHLRSRGINAKVYPYSNNVVQVSVPRGQKDRAKKLAQGY